MCRAQKKRPFEFVCVASAQVCEHMENTISLFGSFAPSARFSWFLSPLPRHFSIFSILQPDEYVFLRQEYTIVENYQLAIWYNMHGKCLPFGLGHRARSIEANLFVKKQSAAYAGTPLKSATQITVNVQIVEYFIHQIILYNFLKFLKYSNYNSAMIYKNLLRRVWNAFAPLDVHNKS